MTQNHKFIVSMAAIAAIGCSVVIWGVYDRYYCGVNVDEGWLVCGNVMRVTAVRGRVADVDVYFHGGNALQKTAVSNVPLIAIKNSGTMVMAKIVGTPKAILYQGRAVVGSTNAAVNE